MLNSSSSVIIDILLNLGLSLTWCWLVNWHLDVLVKIGDHNRPQGRVLGVEHLVVDGPKPVEIEHLLIPACDWLHLTVSLVSDAVIDEQQLWCGKKFGDWVNVWVWLEPWEEWSVVIDVLYECVSSITVGSHGRNNDRTVLVLESLGLAHAGSPSRNCLIVDSC